MANYNSIYTGTQIDEAVGRASVGGAINTELAKLSASLSNKANKTPPVEYDLPLASGVTVGGRCVYSKNQFGAVTVYAAGTLTTSITYGGIFATLPAGFRPSYPMSFPAYSANGGQTDIGTVDVDTSGNMTYRLSHCNAGDLFRFILAFVAP